MIRSKTVYVTNGREFPTLKAAIDYREELVYQLLAKCDGFHMAGVKGRANLMEYVLANKERLRDLLDFSTEEPERDE